MLTKLGRYLWRTAVMPHRVTENLQRITAMPQSAPALGDISARLSRLEDAAAKLQAVSKEAVTNTAQLQTRMEEILSAAAEPLSQPLTKMEAMSALRRDSLFNYTDLVGDAPAVLNPATHGGGSRLCTQGDFASDAYRYWMSRFRIAPVMHRKSWEWFFLADALAVRGFLHDGMKGLGFGVGTEPMSAVFAAHGCHVTATDLDPAGNEAASKGWVETSQHASELASLANPEICPPEKFAELMTFRFVDMNHLPKDLTDFDFTWSSCSLEHLGSLRHGMNYIINSINCLRPGGIAIHTTEFNLSSNQDTFESQGLSIYRRRDIEELVGELEALGHTVEPIDWSRGSGLADRYVDLPPFDAPMHLRLKIGEYDCTSIGLIIRAKS